MSVTKSLVFYASKFLDFHFLRQIELVTLVTFHVDLSFYAPFTSCSFPIAFQPRNSTEVLALSSADSPPVCNWAGFALFWRL